MEVALAAVASAVVEEVKEVVEPQAMTDAMVVAAVVVVVAAAIVQEGVVVAFAVDDG